jgi:hypothetical protein
MAAASALTAPKLPRDSHLCGWPPVASLSLRMMRSAVFFTALIFSGLCRRFGAVLFGIGAIREEAQPVGDLNARSMQCGSTDGVLSAL